MRWEPEVDTNFGGEVGLEHKVSNADAKTCCHVHGYVRAFERELAPGCDSEEHVVDPVPQVAEEIVEVVQVMPQEPSRRERCGVPQEPE